MFIADMRHLLDDKTREKLFYLAVAVIIALSFILKIPVMIEAYQ